MDTITLSTVKILDVKPILTDKQLEKKEGKFINEKHYNKIIKSNYDVYGILEDGTRQLLLKFRKNVIPIDICNTAFNALEKHAQHKNYNRGAASGSLDIKKLTLYSTPIPLSSGIEKTLSFIPCRPFAPPVGISLLLNPPE